MKIELKVPTISTVTGSLWTGKQQVKLSSENKDDGIIYYDPKINRIVISEVQQNVNVRLRSSGTHIAGFGEWRNIQIFDKDDKNLLYIQEADVSNPLNATFIIKDKNGQQIYTIKNPHLKGYVIFDITGKELGSFKAGSFWTTSMLLEFDETKLDPIIPLAYAARTILLASGSGGR